MKIIIFGTGYKYQRNKHYFRNMDIVCFLDNDLRKQGTVIDGYKVHPVNSIFQFSYDYVCIVSDKYLEMREQLLDMGVPASKIVDLEHWDIFKSLIVKEQYHFEDDSLSKGRILLFSHALDLTGAPIVLCRLAHILKKLGYSVTVYSEINSNVEHKKLLWDLMQDHISVELYYDISMLSIESISGKYDYIWVNTLLLYNVVNKVIPLGIPTYWWLHEADDFYENIKDTIIFPQGDNLTILAAGWVAEKTFIKYAKESNIKSFLYGVPAQSITDDRKLHEKIRIALVGAYSERKAQDLLIECISENVHRWEGKLEFNIVGVAPKEKQKLFKSTKLVNYIYQLSPEEMDSFYREIDVLICPSLFDPMPVVVSEAMAQGILSIVSDSVGQSRYICEGYDGLICKAGDVKSLTEKIDWVIANKERIVEMGKKGRDIFKTYFSMEAFERNILSLLELEDIT